MLHRLIKSSPKIALWLVLLIVPLLIGLAWGAVFDDGVYVTLRCARDLAAGRGLTHDPTASESLLHAPLYVLALALAARLGLALPQAGLILSALGWGAAAIVVHCAGRALRADWDDPRPVAAVAAAALVAFNPAVVSTLGSEASWAAALAWAAIAATFTKRWRVQTCALALMLCVHFDLGALTLAVLLLAAQWTQRRRFPLLPSLLLAAIALGWIWMATTYQVSSFFILRSPFSIQNLLEESEFYWLFLPLLLCGAIELSGAARKALWGGVLWAAASLLGSGAVSEATVTTLGLFLAGLGIGWVVAWTERRKLLRLDRARLAFGLALVAGLPLGVAQASSLVQRYQFRPAARQAVEQYVADWLRARAEPGATVFGSQRVGYLADRPTIPWDGGDSDPAALTALLRTLNQAPPGYCVSARSIGWDHLTRTPWFQGNYALLQTFKSPYDAAASFSIWRYRFGEFDLGERQSLDAHLSDEVDLVGYQYGPDRIQPGGSVHATFFLRATQPVSDTFRIVAWVISPRDGVGWAQRDVIVSHESGLVGWWQTGEPLAARLVLTTTPDIPIGAYDLRMSVAQAYSAELLPMYRDGDDAPLDQIVLGDVVVPWQGEFDASERLNADFGDQVRLLGFEVADRLSPGTGFDVELYWEALRPPDDDYVVFVHLVNADGQVVASHDGPPVDGRYATGAWRPGEVVPDVHHLMLDPDVAGGAYQLMVGLYQWPSMERLPAWDSQGVEQAGRVVWLQSLVVEMP
jgi:hypothetical protein